MKKSTIIHLFTILMITGALLSCSESDLGTGSNDDAIITGTADAVAAKQQENKESPEQVFAEFKEMIRTVKTMNRAEIDSLSDEEILKLGAPILKAFKNTVKFDQETLNRLSVATKSATEYSKPSAQKMHDQITREVKSIITSSVSNFEKRKIGVDKIQTQLTTINSTKGTIQSWFDCESWFNVDGNTVYLYPGDSFELANGICPAGSQFNLMSGIHYGQSVTDSKNGNSWTGYDAIMDGQESTHRAFKNGMNNNRISFFEIRNYTRHGIYSEGSNDVEMLFMRFLNIAEDYCKTSECGQNEGAIMFINSADLSVQYNEFIAVASGVRFRNSNGPLVVKNNEAVNSGRNFLQCDNCNGGGIRINRNSMEHTSAYGNTTLVDFISIFKSEGISSDWIQVNNNRARTIGTGSGMDANGSFIMLGDWGGKYQEAKNNIGVNPGQVGIGAASGNNIRVKNNKMYSHLIDGISNVAFYSWKNPKEAPACSNHTFEDNIANWIYGKHDHPDNHGNQNIAWSNESCGLSNDQIVQNTDLDETMGPEIWNNW